MTEDGDSRCNDMVSICFSHRFSNPFISISFLYQKRNRKSDVGFPLDDRVLD